MLVEERRSRLANLVRTLRFASLIELAEELDVSESTIRRDLERLEEQGTAKRIHGGVLYSGSEPMLPHFEARKPSQSARKTRIAQVAAELVDDGDTILLDGGSTTYEVARLLVGRPLHLLTTSLPVANLFASDGASELIFIGGNICSRTGVARGPLADEMLGKLSVGKTILSVAGITDEGFYNNSVMLVGTERAMMRSAGEVIVVADSSKFGRKSLARLCELSQVGTLVVDHYITEDWRAKVLAAGVKLLVAAAAEET